MTTIYDVVATGRSFLCFSATSLHGAQKQSDSLLSSKTTGTMPLGWPKHMLLKINFPGKNFLSLLPNGDVGFSLHMQLHLASLLKALKEEFLLPHYWGFSWPLSPSVLKGKPCQLGTTLLLLSFAPMGSLLFIYLPISSTPLAWWERIFKEPGTLSGISKRCNCPLCGLLIGT